MQYELKYKVIEPKRHTYQNIIDRFGDQPATRYQEATLDIEPRENFHYRPTWDPERELYDERYTALRLTDPYTFTDPRQFYYTPYVTNRAAFHDEVGKTIGYLESRDLLAKMPEGWQTVLGTIVLPLRHYESGAQLVSVAGARFAYGSSLSQCASFAAFDRIGTAQILSRVGIALGSGTADRLSIAKTEWLEGDPLQPLRRLIEEIMIVDDWAEAILAVDEIDKRVDPAFYAGLDEAALLGGAGAYSLFAQHLTTWFADQRKWLDALTAEWRRDETHGEANTAALDRIERDWGARAQDAVDALVTAAAQHIAIAPLDNTVEEA